MHKSLTSMNLKGKPSEWPQTNLPKLCVHLRLHLALRGMLISIFIFANNVS